MGGRLEEYLTVHRHLTPVVLGVVGGALLLFIVYRVYQLRTEGAEAETEAG